MKKSKSIIYMLIFSGVLFAQNNVIFSVMGDVPRSDEENILVQEHIELHNKQSSSEFVFHVGDIKDGKSACSEDVYNRVSGYFLKLNVPMFIVPGDNEWNDCSNPDSAWMFWEKYFLNFETNWKLPYKVQHQSTQKENFSFVYKNTLFIGLNLVGGLIHDSTEWKIRHGHNNLWINEQFEQCKDTITSAVIVAQANPDEKHADFMKKFLDDASKFRKPIYFIHGDGHHWIYEENWLLQNITRIQVDKGGIAPPLKVVIDGLSGKLISFNRKQFKQ